MTQEVFNEIDPLIEGGISLSSILNGFKESVLSQHSGVARPSYVKAGMGWVSTAITNKLVFNLFDGQNDVELFRVDTVNHSVSFTNAGKVIISDTQPAGVSDGQLWFNTSDATMYFRIQDQWLDPFRLFLKSNDISVGDASLPFLASTLKEALEKTNARIGLQEGLYVIDNNVADQELDDLTIRSDQFFAADLTLGIYRQDNTKELVTTGTMRLLFYAGTNTWKISEKYGDDFQGMGLEFSITTTEISAGVYQGQIKVSSNEFNAGTHEGKIAWRFLTRFAKS